MSKSSTETHSVTNRSTPPEAGQHTGKNRVAGSFASTKHRKKYRLALTALIVLAVAVTFGTLGYDNPFPLFSEEWLLISKLRVSAVLVIGVVTLCHSFATVSFHTVTQNRVLTPSIMGFEALYVLIQTSIVFFFSAWQLQRLDGYAGVFLQVGVMMVFAVLLYSWLLSGKLGNLHVMLLVGLVLGGAMAAASTFMQRLLNPSEFDILSARLFGNVSNADTDLLPVAAPICLLAGLSVLLLSRQLNLMSLGKDVATSLGLAYKRLMYLTLTLISLLMAMTTALVGPMTFLGFLVATIAYTLCDTFDHRILLPTAWLIGYVVLLGAYFILHHVFYTAGVVTVIVELVGGLVFLLVVLKRGRL